jgi:hypothetical protein
VQRLEAWESLSVYKHDFRIADLSAGARSVGAAKRGGKRAPQRA